MADAEAAQLEELYRGHALELTRLAVMLVGDRETASDVVQDAFMALQRRGAGLRNRERALP